MKIKVERERCQGHARCNSIAPDLFRLDDDGYIDIDEVDVSSDQVEDARDGEASCPEHAITLIED